SIWAHVRPLRMLEGFRDSTLFELFSHAAANILLPIGGLLVAIFVGWRLSVRTAELELGSGRLFRIWRFLIRYVVPVGMLMVLADAVGFLYLAACRGAMAAVSRSALVPYSAQQMFDLVTDVDGYKDFLPWCGDSGVLKRER